MLNPKSIFLHFVGTIALLASSSFVAPESQAAAPLQIDILSRHSNAETAKQTCVDIYNAATLSAKAPIQSRCLNRPTYDGKADLTIEVVEKDSQSVEIRTTFNTRTMPHIFSEDAITESRILTVNADYLLKQQRLVDRAVQALTHKNMMREIALLAAIKAKDSGSLTLNSTGEYEQNGKKLSFEDAEKSFATDSPRRKHYLRATLEVLFLLGPIGSTWYWSDQNLNRPDWELQFDAKSWRRKIITFDAVRFDNNHFETNAWKHPFLTGYWMHLVGRMNGLNSLETLLLGFASSFTWEYFAEFKELVSLNDLIITPLAGLAIGEVFFQLSEFFQGSESNWFNNILCGFTGSPFKVHDALDRYRPHRASGKEVDRFGFRKDVWHSFELFASSGYSTATRGKMLNTIGLHTEIVNIKGAGQAGKQVKVFGNTEVSEMLLSIGFDEKGMNRYMAVFKAALFGYYTQNITQSATGRLKGYSFLVAEQTAYTYDRRKYPIEGGGKLIDKLAIIDVIGTRIELKYVDGDFKVSAKLEVSGDFAMVTSIAYSKFKKSNPNDELKSVLEENHYYYAFGLHVNSSLSASYKKLEFGASLETLLFQSIDGMDRRREEVRDSVNIYDQKHQGTVWVSYTLPGDRIKLQLALTEIVRAGQVLSTSAQSTERIISGNLLFLF